MTITVATAPAAPELSAVPPGRDHHRLWLSDEPLVHPGTYLECVATFESTGRWPILVPPDPGFDTGQKGAESTESTVDPARIDPVEVLAGWWARTPAATRKPFGARFPGLARRSGRRADAYAEAGNTGSVLATRGTHRLGLVETGRPADIPAKLNWRGAPELSAVLRSWEVRFGAALVMLGDRDLILSVAAPPQTPNRALDVAAEHYAVLSGRLPEYANSLREFADSLVHRRIWRFRLDEGLGGRVTG